MGASTKEDMLMNWPERVWIYSPLRVFFLKREIAEWLRLTGHVDVRDALEIGCGLGKGARLLVDRMGFRRVAALDLEEILVRRAARSLPTRFSPSISFFVGDAQDLPFSDRAFDAVVNFGIIHHVLDWRRCLSEIARVLRPGGHFFFEEIYPSLYANFFMKRIVRHPRDGRFSREDFLAALSENRLDLVAGVRVTSRYGVVGAARRS